MSSKQQSKKNVLIASQIMDVLLKHGLNFNQTYRVLNYVKYMVGERKPRF